MYKLFILLTGLLLSVSYSHASDELQDKQKVFEIIKQYSGLVSCMNSFAKDPENKDPTTIKDIHTVEYDPKQRSFVFYVLWSGDLGCSGGSGGMSSFITEIARYGGDWKPYTVQDDYAFGENVGFNYRFIESIKKINTNKFEVVGWDYADSKYGGEDGGSNFPANKFKYTVERERFDPWKITHQALLEQRK